MPTLNDRMDFEHVIRVHDDGTVTDADAGIYAPEVYWQDDEVCIGGDDWTLLSGFTGQYGYNGPVMHSSEYVGGGLERHILDNPGLYVTVTVSDIDDETDDDIVGWAIAYREN